MRYKLFFLPDENQSTIMESRGMKMGIPDYQSFMKPLLDAISDGNEYELKEIKKKLTKLFNLTEDDLREKIPSQRAFLFDNRLGWANTYLKKAGLIVSEKRGRLRITQEGKEFLTKHGAQIRVKDLKTIDKFREFQGVKVKADQDMISENDTGVEEKSPEEVIDNAYEIINGNLIAEILSTVKSCSPLFFEKLVVDLLSREFAQRRNNKSVFTTIYPVIVNLFINLPTLISIVIFKSPLRLFAFPNKL